MANARIFLQRMPDAIVHANAISRLREKGVMALCIVLLFFAALAVASPAWAAGENGIAVIYPDIGEPYHGIFAKIIEGIEDKVGSRVANHPVRADTDIAVLKASLLRQDTRVVIALGRQGIKTATALNSGIGVVAGGVLTVPGNEARTQPGMRLSPEPPLSFARTEERVP